uniref:Sema domain-containing protein n=1 Tax=Tetranychus urticae TaxID=32264 RepID=A0A158P4V4_TETUR
MFFHLLIWTFQFCLLIQKTYLFRTPKHDSMFYYKTHDSVFLTNPKNHTTSYGIYVAGKTITIDIPTSVAKMSDILDWKVVDFKKDRLMFVHKNKPYILINQEIIRGMEYDDELSGSIIAFGDNEALHVPTIKNPGLFEPIPKWNYIELLHFDAENEKVSVRRYLPWLSEDDYQFIIEWNMTDYIHFDNKLYLLIKRSISNDDQSVTQEISIIRLCLDKGIELISSAVEIRFTQEAFQSNKIIDLFFVFLFKPLYNDTIRYQVHTTQLKTSDNTKAYQVYYIGNFVSLFEETANDCASGFGNITLLRPHLRSEVGECKKTSYKNCSTKENIVPSRDVSLVVTGELSTSLNLRNNFRLTVAHKIQFVALPYPFDTASIIMPDNPEQTDICEYDFAEQPICMSVSAKSSSFINASSEVVFHTNKRPYGALFVTKETNKILFIPIEMCSHLKTCTQCIMYGLYSDCIWSNSICTRDDQPKNKATLTVDHCFKIINISPLILEASSPTILTIELDKPLIKEDQEQLVIQAGDDHCNDIIIYELFIICSMNLTKSGKFNIHVSLRNDRYADTSIISAISNDKVHIFESDYALIIILLLFLCLIITSFALIFYYRKIYKELLNRFKKVSRPRKVERFVGTLSDAKFIKFFDSKKKSKLSAKSRVSVPIVSSTMDTLDDSTITNKPSWEQDSLGRTMRSELRQMYPRRKLLSSKRK